MNKNTLTVLVLLLFLVFPANAFAESGLSELGGNLAYENDFGRAIILGILVISLIILISLFIAIVIITVVKSRK